jgi:ethanolamine ammonia-lyase small subunit
MSDLESVTPDPWKVLRGLTEARIALGRAGSSLPTRAQLEFQWAHARARDAVHHRLDAESLNTDLLRLFPEVIHLQSAASDRATYLQRPDLGRRLDANSRVALDIRKDDAPQPDLAIVVADGLSAFAIERNAARFLSVLLPELVRGSIRLAPLCLVRQARVAIGDEIGELLGANMVAVLIGERPGLSSPDSMGIYMSWQPKVGLQDAARNCLSNIRAQGMSDIVATEKFMFILQRAMQLKMTGVALKDETVTEAISAKPGTQKFIL